MVRNRSHETSLVGILAALAALGQIGSAPAQTYSVVGQSSVKTAATGRRPIADRIKAANRPIRIKAEADLAPDEGLIRELSAGDAPVRDWTPEPPTVEFSATTGPEPIAASTTATEAAAMEAAAMSAAAALAEPAVVPPPVEGAIAANPTTSENDDAVGEVAVLEDDSAEDTAPTGMNAAATAPSAATPPVVSQKRNVAPPRRAPARVTPQRREALLERLRAALVEMPRPFGLVPMPAPAPTHHRPRSAMQKLPMPVAVTPVPTEPPTSEGPSSTTASEAVDGTLESASVAGDTVTTEPALVETVTPSDASSSDTPTSETPPETVATDAAADASSEPEAVAIATPADETPAVVEDTSAPDGVATAEDGNASPDVAATSPVTPSTATNARPVTPQRSLARPLPSRTRAPQSIVQRQRPLERLQATVESFPRPLGILPAPRPAVRSQMPQSRSPASVARGVQRPSSVVPGHVAAVAPRPVPLAVSSDDHLEAVAPKVPGADAREPQRHDVGSAADAGQGPETLAEIAPLAPCIEVTLEGPEGSVVRGERVTLHLTVRNTGTVAARAVSPMIHFGAGIEPTACTGRTGMLTEEGSVVFEALPELAPGETVEVDVVAACDTVGAVPFQAVVWCGEGDSAEQVPVDGQLLVVPGRVASAPGAGLRR